MRMLTRRNKTTLIYTLLCVGTAAAANPYFMKLLRGMSLLFFIRIPLLSCFVSNYRLVLTIS